MKLRGPFLALTGLGLAAALPLAAQDRSAEAVAAAALDAAPVFDGHNDVPIQLRIRFDNQLDRFDFNDTRTAPHPSGEARGMHTDLSRLREGKVGAQFWSVYVSPRQSEVEAVRQTLEQIDVTKRLVERYPGDLALALTADDVERAIDEGRIASLIGIEGGHSIGSSLAVLRQMYDLGVRYMTLTHSLNTPWADSATDTPVHQGLTGFGEAVIREMNRMGMIVDLSHVSAATMHDVLDIARAPVVFSHSSARALNAHPRNVPDDVLARLKENGGIVMVVALPAYNTEALRQWQAHRAGEQARLDALHPGYPDRAAGELARWEAANPAPGSTIADMADHIDHIRRLAGIDHIGIGADYDGMPSGPEGMEDVSGYPSLFEELARRGYSQTDLEKISLRNALRVLRRAEQVSAALADEPADDRLIEPATP
jgi:membrane dipeptidase